MWRRYCHSSVGAVVIGWWGLCATVCAVEPAYQVESREEVNIPMRDGVELAANICLPKSPGKFPAIIARTPYGKGAADGGFGRTLASRGYVYIMQDCRGKGTSGGKWTPYVNESRDGVDTYHWITAQPWSNGAIGTTGGSYVGYTQWTSAPDAGPALKATFAEVPSIDPYDDVAYVGGAYQLQLLLSWGSATGGISTVRKWSRDDWLRALPLSDPAGLDYAQAPYLRDWVMHPVFDDYWRVGSIRGRRATIAAPGYVACGWFDIFARSVFEHVQAVRRDSPSPEARKHQHILMGPWTHGINGTRKVGDMDFGPDSLIDLSAMRSRWYDRWLKGVKNDVDSWPPLRLFVMGRNVWRDEQQWPLARTRFTPYYFHSGGRANTLAGDGQLTSTQPAAQSADRFDYDPDDPAPTAGGCNLGGPAGPCDQTAVEQRRDVLVFSSDALTAPLETTGPVKVVLYASSTATDTDWTAKLCDVQPDGRPIGLCDGILRARYRNSRDTPELIEPGEVYRYEIDLWVTSNVFLPGHRLRVEISSSNFPRFDRNPNTGHPFGADAERRKAAQTVYHDAQRPSHIVLPIIP